MARQPIDTLRDILQKTQSPLLLLPENPSADVVAGAWGLASYLEKRGVSVTVAVSDPYNKRAHLEFLPEPKKVLSTLAGSKNFVLVFDTTRNPISDIQTERGENEVRIVLTPEKGSIDPRDFSFMPAKLSYDLAITLGCAEKEAIGKLYEEGADIFYEIPVVNIDCQIGNDGFGQINLVDMTASSVSEVIASTLLTIDEAGVDEKTAQCLLSGIIVATDSFQKKNTTPNALYISAKLIEHGAKQQEIVTHLYRTQPLGLIKLWGRVMAKLQCDEALGFVWARVTIEDFVQSRMHPNDLPTVIEKIRSNYASGNVFMLLYEKKSGSTVGIVQSAHSDALVKKLEVFDFVSRGEYAEVRLEGVGIKEAEEKILNVLHG